MVATASLPGEAVHYVLHDLRASAIERVTSLAGLEENVGILRRAPQDGPIGREGALAMLPNEPFLHDGAKIFVEQRNDFVDFVGGAEAVEKVQEWNARFQRGGLGEQCKIVRLLDGIGSEHRKARRARGHHVAMISKNGKGMRGHGA